MAGSIINDDKKVLDKRNKPLKDDREENLEVKASKRDQLIQKLMTKLEDENMNTKLVSAWETGNSDRGRWLTRQQVYLRDWDEHLESSAEGPFQQASSLHLPMPLIVVKTMHARFLQALLGIDPPFQVRPRTEASTEVAQLVQELMRYMLNEHVNNRKGAFEQLDLWLWDWITTGVGLLKVRWDAKYQRYIDVEETPELGPPQFVSGPDGEEGMIPSVQMAEKDVSKTEKSWEGLILERVAPEDLLIVGGNGDPQEADIVIQSKMATASELWSNADRGIFKTDAVKAVIQSGADSHIDNEASNIKNQQATNAGMTNVDSGVKLDRYRILECYLKADIDGSGINSEIVVWVHRKSRQILRATFLHRINKSGKRPFFKIDFIRRPGQEYGVGLLEVLHPISVEMDAMHNMRIDFGLLSTMPFGFYRPTSSIDPETIQLEPGALIPVDNPQTDVFFPNLGNRTAFGYQEEAALQNLVERLTGISDLSLGVITGQQGATRTATGTRALVGELSANLDVFVRRMNIGWKQILEFMLDVLQQRLPANFSFRVTGDAKSDFWANITTREQIRGDFDLEVSPNSATSNQQIREQRALEIVQMTSNPIDMQLGIVTPLERYEAIKNRLQAIGVKDYSKFIRKPDGINRQLSPEEEANRLLRGVPVPVTMDMDHEGFIAYIQEIQRDDLLLGQFTEEEIATLVAQAQRHRQMMVALQRMAAQQRNMQQMQQNAAMAPQQAMPGAGLGPAQPQGGRGTE